MNRTYVIAEAGVNHNGSIDRAKSLIEVAAECGADAVKFQTFKSEKLVSRVAPTAEYQKKSNQGATQLEMLKKLELSVDAHFELLEHCQSRGIQFLSTPFDLESLEFLVEKIRVPKIKISSGELTNAPLLARAGASNKPLILSTGMSNLTEIEVALSILAYGAIYGRKTESLKPGPAQFGAVLQSPEAKSYLERNLVLLQCTTEYPAPFTEVNLKAMVKMAELFKLPVGFSDHTMGYAAPIAAVGLGATVVEKHFTLDRTLPGPDHKASLEPGELKAMIVAIRQVEMALGSSDKKSTQAEQKNIAVARKSLVAAASIGKGEKFTEKNLTTKRPGTGLSPIYFWTLLGREATRDYSADDLIEEKL